MRPETLGEFVIATLIIIVAVACAVIAKLEGVSHVKTLALLGSTGALVSIYFGWRHLRRAKPYIKDVRRADWIVVHLESHRGVFVKIPSSEHKRGKHPKVEFQRGDSIYGSNDLEAEVAENGDVEIFHPRNSFVPPAFKESRVVIRA